MIHDWFDGEVEVLKHLVRLPVSKDLDDIGVDLSDQQRHCTGSAERPEGGFGREKLESVPN